MGTPNVPGRRINKDALERIIQRAAELQAGEMDTGEEMTEQELLRLGTDVGIDGRFLRQAMYEESTGAGASAETGFAARWFGPGIVRASRVVQGERASVEQGLDHWMTETELLSVKRRLPDRTLYERQKGFMAEVKRGFGVGGRDYRLAKAKEISINVTSLEAGYSHVELLADITPSRSGFMGGSFAMGAVGAAGIVGVTALSAPVLIPLFIGAAFGSGAFAISRGHRPVAERTQLALEQVLDRLEAGEIKPKHKIEPGMGFPFGSIAHEIRKAITDVSESTRRSRRLP